MKYLGPKHLICLPHRPEVGGARLRASTLRATHPWPNRSFVIFWSSQYCLKLLRTAVFCSVNNITIVDEKLSIGRALSLCEVECYTLHLLHDINPSEFIPTTTSIPTRIVHPRNPLYLAIEYIARRHDAGVQSVIARAPPCATQRVLAHWRTRRPEYQCRTTRFIQLCTIPGGVIVRSPT